jgi:hypothetical protein
MPGSSPALSRGKTGISGLVNAFRAVHRVVPPVFRAFFTHLSLDDI